MLGLETIKDKSKTIAVVIRKNIKVKGLKFFSSPNYPFQIGFHNREKNTVLKAHFHPGHNFFIKLSQEVLFILKGKIRVDLYNSKKKFLKSKILKGGDSIFFVAGGHGVKFLEKTKIYEVKQGPYLGDKKAKIFI
ncbi:hypothetical protein COT75_01270 [Candidatus Beckwithbacteria bacterium CG10_big_fil_rev_8_21_14_0_10_34_10]|uniref:Cupin 2 conserved barrel domain-containing protein n=1 Tax=Candidatus Beckwithbacteria bacterium CG10_big_fil_rev_8_21_14_0_10_34_10 TaxID=1974495 RepID=A0A2H0W9Z3_9BACT|nr:MAG: hypothetical protein COT75_01270 [Candidatus Beckwithbacteria bacterium CG10_big_fil_rev_8_21_14_0_10_34_10]